MGLGSCCWAGRAVSPAGSVLCVAPRVDPQSSSDSDFSPHRQERSRWTRLHLEVGSSLSGEACKHRAFLNPL